MSRLKSTMQSNAVVGLHIRNDSIYGGGNISIEVPVNYLVRTRTAGAPLTNAVLISNVRHSATTALLESRPAQANPSNSFAYFELSSYQSKDGSYLSVYENTLSQVLEAAVTINIHDSDEGVVLHIFCAFVSTYHSSYSRGAARNIRASAAAAGGRERKRLAQRTGTNLKCWAANKRQSIACNSASRAKYAPVHDGYRPHLMQQLQQLRNRAVSLIVPEDRDEKEFIREKADAVMKCAETTLDFIVEGAIRSSETFCQLATPYPHQPFSDAYLIPRTDLSEEIRDKEEGVEIVFEPNDNTTPSEWKIIFELDDLESDSVVDFDSMVKQGDGLVIDLLDEVQSFSSDDSDVANTLVSDTDISYDMVKRHISDGDISYDSSFAAVSVDEDETSWFVLDEDRSFC